MSEERILNYVSFNRALRSSLPPEEWQSWEQVATRATEDPDFADALYQDPAGVLATEYNLSGDALTRFANALYTVPSPMPEVYETRPPELYLPDINRIRAEFTDTEVETLKQIVNDVIDEPGFYQTLLANPLDTLAPYGIDQTQIDRLAGILSEANRPLPAVLPPEQPAE